jgi:hypothetical protein
MLLLRVYRTPRIRHNAIERLLKEPTRWSCILTSVPPITVFPWRRRRIYGLHPTRVGVLDEVIAPHSRLVGSPLWLAGISIWGRPIGKEGAAWMTDGFRRPHIRPLISRCSPCSSICPRACPCTVIVTLPLSFGLLLAGTGGSIHLLLPIRNAALSFAF